MEIFAVVSYMGAQIKKESKKEEKTGDGVRTKNWTSTGSERS